MTRNVTVVVNPQAAAGGVAPGYAINLPAAGAMDAAGRLRRSRANIVIVSRPKNSPA